MTVLLVPSLNFVAGRPEVYVPYGLLSLEASARLAGFDAVQVLQFSSEFWDTSFSNSDCVVNALVQAVELYSFDSIGLSTVCSSAHYSLSLASAIKARRPNVSVFLGGPYVTKLAPQVLEAFDCVDAVFVGESEPAFDQYCRNLLRRRKNPLQGIPGVVTRGPLHSGGRIVEELDALPVVESQESYRHWATLDLGRNVGKNFVPIEATRGCPLKCSFCSTKQVWGASVRRKSPDRLLADVRLARSVVDVDLISLIGDNVGVPRNRFLAFCQELANRDDHFHWACSLKLDRFEPGDLALAWDAGCRGMFIGVETASKETLRLVNKASNLDREIENIEAAIDRGFLVETSFIIGFPWETEEEVKATFELHCKLLKAGAKRSQVGILSPIPGTEIVADERLDWNIVPGTFSDDGVPLSESHSRMIMGSPILFSNFASYQTPRLPRQALQSYQSAAAQVNGLYQRTRRRSPALDYPFAGIEPQRSQQSFRP